MTRAFNTQRHKVQAVNFPLQKLPLDIARYILETAASEDTSTGLRLLRVSKATYEWIIPIVYRHLKITSDIESRFILALQRRVKSDPTFFAKHVRTISFLASSHSEEAMNDLWITSMTLSACSGAQAVAWCRKDAPRHFRGPVHGPERRGTLLKRLPSQVEFLPQTLTTLFLGSSVSDIAFSHQHPFAKFIKDTLPAILERCPALVRLALTVSLYVPRDCAVRTVRDVMACVPETVALVAIDFLGSYQAARDVAGGLLELTLGDSRLVGVKGVADLEDYEEDELAPLVLYESAGLRTPDDWMYIFRVAERHQATRRLGKADS